MEIVSLTKDSLRIKGKQGSLVIDPSSSLKTEADAALFSTKDPKNFSVLISGCRLIIGGAGEYEVAGIKVSCIQHENSLVYSVKVDNVTVIVGKAEAISKVSDKLSESHILVASVSEGSLQEAVTSLAPRVVVLYGEKVENEAKNLGKAETKAVNKYVTTSEKLPTDMEVVVLG